MIQYVLAKPYVCGPTSCTTARILVLNRENGLRGERQSARDLSLYPRLTFGPRPREDSSMFLELTYRADDKAVLINMALVRYVFPMAEGCDLIFDPHHSASVSESFAEIQQRLGTVLRKKTARRKVTDAERGC